MKHPPQSTIYVNQNSPMNPLKLKICHTIKGPWLNHSYHFSKSAPKESTLHPPFLNLQTDYKSNEPKDIDVLIPPMPLSPRGSSSDPHQGLRSGLLTTLPIQGILEKFALWIWPITIDNLDKATQIVGFPFQDNVCIINTRIQSIKRIIAGCYQSPVLSNYITSTKIPIRKNIL